MKFFIEYEIKPLRAVYYKEVEAKDFVEATRQAQAIHPQVRIRGIRKLEEKKP